MCSSALTPPPPAPITPLEVIELPPPPAPQHSTTMDVTPAGTVKVPDEVNVCCVWANAEREQNSVINDVIMKIIVDFIFFWV